MKHSIISLLFLFVLLSSALSQNIAIELSNAFKQGDVTVLEKYLASRVAIATPTMSLETKTKAETSQILSEFFKKNQPKGFKIIHQSLKLDQGFIVGELNAGKENFRTHCMFKKSNDSYLVNQIRIENL